MSRSAANALYLHTDDSWNSDNKCCTTSQFVQLSCFTKVSRAWMFLKKSTVKLALSSHIQKHYRFITQFVYSWSLMPDHIVLQPFFICISAGSKSDHSWSGCVMTTIRQKHTLALICVSLLCSRDRRSLNFAFSSMTQSFPSNTAASKAMVSSGSGLRQKWLNTFTSSGNEGVFCQKIKTHF